MAAAYIPHFIATSLWAFGFVAAWAALSLLAVGFYRLLTGERVL